MLDIFYEKNCRRIPARFRFIVQTTLEVLHDIESRSACTQNKNCRASKANSSCSFLILIIPNLFILTYMYYDRFQSRRVEKNQANLELARGVSMSFETFFQDIVINELLIGTALSSSQPLSNQDQNRILAKARTMRSTFRQLFWVNPAGRILAATDSESDRNRFNRALGLSRNSSRTGYCGQRPDALKENRAPDIHDKQRHQE